jgi:hypothetical protein
MEVESLEKKHMHNMVALYRGHTLQSGHLIGVTEDPDIVLKVAMALHPKPSANSSDDVVECLESGLRTALDIIEDEASHQGAKTSGNHPLPGSTPLRPPRVD